MDVHGTKLVRTLFTIATGVERGAAFAADGGAMERAEALACARVHSAILLVPPQLNAIR